MAKKMKAQPNAGAAVAAPTPAALPTAPPAAAPKH